MKRSEMIKALADNFCHAYEIEIHAETIIDFLESKGMQPPPIKIEKNFEGTPMKYTMDVNEWEKENDGNY